MFIVKLSSLIAFVALLFNVSLSFAQEVIWERFYSIEDLESIPDTLNAEETALYGFEVIPTEDGGFVIGCYNCNVDYPYYDRTVVFKTDSEGEIEWEYCRVIPELWQPIHQLYYFDGQYILLTSELSEDGERIHPVITALSRDGEEQWSRSYPSVYNVSSGSSLHFARNSDILLYGQFRDYTEFILRLNSDWDSLDFKEYNWDEEHPTWLTFGCIYQLAEGRYIIPGTQQTGIAERYLGFFFELDEELDSIRAIQYDWNGPYYSGPICEAGNGDIIMTGQLEVHRGGTWRGDVYLARFTYNYELVWREIYGSEWDDSAWDFEVLPNGNIVFVGYTNAYGVNGWIQIVDGDDGHELGYFIRGGRFFSSVLVNGARELVALGMSAGRIWVLSIDPYATSVEQNEEPKIPIGFIVNPAYPNPFNANTRIEFYLERPMKMRIKVYNVGGRSISEVVKKYEAGRNSFTWNVKAHYFNIPNGRYYIVFQTQNLTQSVPITLIK